MSRVRVMLDGRESEGSPDMTILELARREGVEIPTLCEHRALSPYGSCRVCLVEEEKSGALVASCATAVAPDMVISTQSDRVRKHREMIVRMMLASHPSSCPVCDKGNRCELRRVAADLGIAAPRMDRVAQPTQVLDLNPFIERDMSKCILCGQCIRVCQELVVEGALSYRERGFDAHAATFSDGILGDSECTYCGACVSACPTGAMMEKKRVYSGSGDRTVETVCPYCGCACPIQVTVKGDRIVRVEPADPEQPLCVRGSYGLDFVHSPDRLRTPHIRCGDELVPVDWDEALAYAGENLTRIIESRGPDAAAVLGSSKGTNEENYLLQRFARGVLGTNNVDNGGRLYNAAVRVGLNETIGVPETTDRIGALADAEVIVVVGADLVNSAPQLAYAVRRAVKLGDAQLILIDPGRTRLGWMADMWLQPRFGTDGAFLAAVTHVICEENLVDQEFVARKTEGYQALCDAAAEWSPEWAEELSGIPARHIRQVARRYAGASQAAIIYGTGVTQQNRPGEGVKQLANLTMLTGNLWRTGGGLYAVQKESNGRGACEMGALPDFLPGYHRVDHRGMRRGYEETWGIEVSDAPGLSALEMMLAAERGEIGALYVVGENPLQNYPNPGKMRRALEEVDFLLVQDLFLSETAEMADVVLPAASFCEKDGTFINFEGQIRTLNRVLDPSEGSLTDWEIVLGLSEVMGSSLPFSSVGDIQAEVSDLLPEIGPLDTGRHARDMENGGPGAAARRWPASRGIARFSVPELTLPEPPPEEYPFTLVVSNTLWGQGGGGRTGRSKRLLEFAGDSFVEVCTEDAGRLGLEQGNRVRLVSPVGDITVRAALTDALPQGVLALPAHFRDAPATALFDVTLDRDTRTPMMKSCHVRMERRGSDEG